MPARDAPPPRLVDEMTDAELDALLPLSVRKVSPAYWSSVVVARRAAQIMTHLHVRRALDVGSGPGKFCVVAAARAPAIELVGIEHRAPLVEVAQSLAFALGVGNVTFSVGDATRAPWTGFDALYFFNSFAENDFAPEEQYDLTVELSRARHIAEVKRVAGRLAEAPAGTLVLTYHGLSGPIPTSYELVHAEAFGGGWLRAWWKTTAEASGTFWLEEGAAISRWALHPPPEERATEPE